MGIHLRHIVRVLVLVMAGLSGVVCLDSLVTCAYSVENQISKKDLPRVGIADLLTQFKANQEIDSAEIKAEDLITIIKETPFDINLNNCLIVGTLDFSQLPKVPLEKIKLPQTWNKQEKEAWISRNVSISVDGLHVVSNRIQLKNTEIITKKHQPKNHYISIKAEKVYFEKQITFDTVTCHGETSFAKATFAENLDFQETIFRKASFASVTFIGEASFAKAIIEGAVFSDAVFSDTSFYVETNFQGVADFKQAVFCREMSFFGATFGDQAIFNEATFIDTADFDKVTFGNEANFINSWYLKKISFANAEFGYPADFIDAHFWSGLDFSSAKFHNEAAFNNTVYNGAVKFEKSIFGKAVYFHSAKFQGKENVSLKNAKINGKADFRLAEFSGEVYFRSVVFNDDVSFEETTFMQMASFLKATFEKKVNFSTASFGDLAYFNDASIGGETEFHVAEFKGEAYFAGAVFAQNVYFTQAIFNKAVHAEDAQFKKLASFRDAQFQGGLDLDRTLFYGYADFRRTKIEFLDFMNETNPSVINAHIDFRAAEIAKAKFQDIIFLKDVNFSNARFGKPLRSGSSDNSKPESAVKESAEQSLTQQEKPVTTFNSVTFNSNASLFGTKFYGTTELVNVKFVKDAIFTNARFQSALEHKQPSLILSHVSFGNLIINWDQLPNLKIRASENGKEAAAEPLSQIFKNLEVQFRSRKQLRDANNAYYQMKIAELAEARTKPNVQRRIWLEIEWIFWGICCGYGTKLSSTLLTFFLTCLFFTLIYYASGKFKKNISSGDKDESAFKLKGFVSPKLYLTRSPSKKKTSKELEEKTKFAYAALLSLAVLFKLQYKQTTISGKLGKIDLKNIVIVEWAVGYLLYIALIFTLKNTSPLFSAIVAML